MEMKNASPLVYVLGTQMTTSKFPDHFDRSIARVKK